MPEDKQEQIISEIKRWAEEMRYGVIAVELKIHLGKIMGLEEIPERTKRKIA